MKPWARAILLTAAGAATGVAVAAPLHRVAPPPRHVAAPPPMPTSITAPTAFERCSGMLSAYTDAAHAGEDPEPMGVAYIEARCRLGPLLATMVAIHDEAAR